MPELPEVETIRRQLVQSIVGKTIAEIDLRYPRSVRGNIQRLRLKTVRSIRRFSKLLVIDCDGGISVAIHLKMTGRLIVQKKTHDALLEIDYASHKHTRIAVTFLDGDQLFFHDQRTFGYWDIQPTEAIPGLPYIRSLGPEFLSSMSLTLFTKKVASTKRKIKPLLLDQTFGSGVGNIYASEALWASRIHPERIASTLTLDEVKRLFAAIEGVLSLGIANGGASKANFRDALGNKGSMQDHFMVYNQANRACPRCKTIIHSFKLSGRGTFFCPHCQQ